MTRRATRRDLRWDTADGDQTASPLQSQTAGKRHRVMFPHLPRDQLYEQVFRSVATVHLTITARKLLIRFYRITQTFPTTNAFYTGWGNITT